MVLPSRAAMNAPPLAPSAPADVLDLPEGWEFAAETRAREKLAHDNSGLNASWGNARKPASVHDDGWGSAPSNSRKLASVHDGWGCAPSPAPTMDGSHTGLPSSDNSRRHLSGTVYGQNMNSKGPGKGSWKGWNHQGKNKRGRDPRDDWCVLDRAEREARQKVWNTDGRSTAESWYKSTTLRTHMRILLIPSAKALRNKHEWCSFWSLECKGEWTN